MTAASHKQRPRLLVYGMNYLPEMTGVGKYTGEMAEWLAANDSDVIVVTAPPYYPQWRLQPGYRRFWYSTERPAANLRVIRCPIWVPATPSGLKRIVHLLSFAVSSTPVVLWLALRRRFNVLWTVEPTLATAPMARVARFIVGAKAWLHVQDLEVDAAFALGMASGERLQRFVLWIERRLMAGFDRVSTISRAMRYRLESKGYPTEQVRYFRNWANIDEIQPLDTLPPLRAELGVPDDVVLALYSGNMGAKQGLSIMADAALQCADDVGIFFLFCGSGPGRAPLEAKTAGLTNVRFADLQPKERLNELLGSADIHLLPQRDSVAELVLPSKLTGMLASGRPIVAGCGAETELAEFVSQCGEVVPAGDAARFAAAIRNLAAESERRKRLGKAARALAESTLSRDAILQSFRADLVELLD